MISYAIYSVIASLLVIYFNVRDFIDYKNIEKDANSGKIWLYNLTFDDIHFNQKVDMVIIGINGFLVIMALPYIFTCGKNCISGLLLVAIISTALGAFKIYVYL